MFKFTLTTLDRFQVNVDPTNVGSDDAGSNLDISVELFNNTTSIGFYNPASTLNVAIDTTLTPGTYYMRIDAVGNSNSPKYGSLGSYSIFAQETPVTVLSVKKSIDGDKHKFDWIINADEQVTDQELEISTDGKNFDPVAELPGNDRTFNYKPNVTTTAQYRLKVTFKNERQYYSNIVSLHTIASSERPRLISNFINTGNIVVSNPGNYSYTIYDFTGKTISKGQLTKGMNNISTSGMSAGIYMISFINSSGQWTDKLVKQ